jgi:hypothetical protein
MLLFDASSTSIPFAERTFGRTFRYVVFPEIVLPVLPCRLMPWNPLSCETLPLIVRPVQVRQRIPTVDDPDTVLPENVEPETVSALMP